MKRNVDRLPQGSVRTYIPKAFGNRDLPESERIRCKLRTPTLGEKRDILVMHARPGETVVAAQLRWQTEACRRFVEEIGPYEEAHKVITNGAELAEFGAVELVAEIGGELLGEFSLDEQEKKSSGVSSGSHPPETQASLGTAATAENRSATRSEDAPRALAVSASDMSSRVLESSTDVRRPGSETKEREVAI